MSIRRSRMTDASSLAALSIEVWLGTYIRCGINAFFADYALEEFTSQKMAAILKNGSEHLFISDNVEGIDGFVRITQGSDCKIEGCSDTEITTLYVQMRHQGKQIGKRLLATAIEHCKANGVRQPWLAVNSENVKAIEFYISNGFQNVGRTHFKIQDQSYLNEILAIDLRA